MTGSNRFDPSIVTKLVCPLTRTPLRYDDARQELVSDEAQLAYPIDDGIPVLLVEAARRIGASEDPEA